MKLQMGSQLFLDVQVPLLWGTRAVIQDQKQRLSIIDLEGDRAHVEVLAGEPAPGVSFIPRIDGIVIMRDGTELYLYNAQEQTIEGVGLRLPTCQITPTGTRIGGAFFGGNVVSGFGVGIAVTEDGVSMGAPMPPGLAKLIV